MFGGAGSADEFDDEESLVDPHYRPPPLVEAPQALPIAVHQQQTTAPAASNSSSSSSTSHPPGQPQSSSPKLPYAQLASSSTPPFSSYPSSVPFASPSLASSGSSPSSSSTSSFSSFASPSPPLTHSPTQTARGAGRIPTSWGGAAAPTPQPSQQRSAAFPAPALQRPTMPASNSSTSSSLFAGLSIVQPQSQPAAPAAMSSIAHAIFSSSSPSPPPPLPPVAAVSSPALAAGGAAAGGAGRVVGGPPALSSFVQLPTPVSSVVTPHSSNTPGIFSQGESAFDDED